MFSRAHLLIERDWERLERDALWGVEAHPINDDSLFEWSVKIEGFKESIWEGGIFELYIKFNENYNSRPPEVFFQTIPFHPNVEMTTGKPCVDFLDNVDQWKECYTLSFIIISIQVMLANPVLEDAVNPDAVKMLVHNPLAYKQMIEDCVALSKSIAVGLCYDAPDMQTPETSSNVVRTLPPVQETVVKHVAKVSFENYYTTWSGIATSKATEDFRNPLLEAIKDKPELQKAHCCFPVEEIAEQAEKRADEQRNLLYGKFQHKTTDDKKQAKLELVNKMKKIYLQPKSPRKTAVSDNGGHIVDEWEVEVDALVEWTKQLNDDLI